MFPHTSKIDLHAVSEAIGDASAKIKAALSLMPNLDKMPGTWRKPCMKRSNKSAKKKLMDKFCPYPLRSANFAGSVRADVETKQSSLEAQNYGEK